MIIQSEDQRSYQRSTDIQPAGLETQVASDHLCFFHRVMTKETLMSMFLLLAMRPGVVQWRTAGNTCTTIDHNWH